MPESELEFTIAGMGSLHDPLVRAFHPPILQPADHIEQQAEKPSTKEPKLNQKGGRLKKYLGIEKVHVPETSASFFVARAQLWVAPPRLEGATQGSTTLKDSCFWLNSSLLKFQKKLSS